MKEFELKYGRGTVKFSIKETNIIGIIDNNPPIINIIIDINYIEAIFKFLFV